MRARRSCVVVDSKSAAITMTYKGDFILGGIVFSPHISKQNKEMKGAEKL